MRYIQVYKISFRDNSLNIKPSGIGNHSFEELHVSYDKKKLFSESLKIYNQTANFGYRIDKSIRSKNEFDLIYGSCYIVYIQAYLQAKQLIHKAEIFKEKIVPTELIQIEKFNSSDHFFSSFWINKFIFTT